MRSPRKQRSPFYAYCVFRLEPDQGWEVFPGISARPVFPVREGKLAMLVSRLEGPFTGNAHSVIEHGRVVHRVFEQRTVLPFRFGTTFETEQQVRHVLIANRGEFLEAMNRLRGKAEMHVKLLFTRHDVQVHPRETHDHPAELMRLAAERLAGLFRPMEEQVSVRALQNGDSLVDFAHLIEEVRISAYQRAYTNAAEQMRDCQLLVSGPWPPYHFLPSGIRIPAASEIRLTRGRRPARRAVPPPPMAQAAKA